LPFLDLGSHTPCHGTSLSTCVVLLPSCPSPALPSSSLEESRAFGFPPSIEINSSPVFTAVSFLSFAFKTIEELEKEMLNGQKLQGPQTSAEVYRILKQKGLIDK
jgi:hypothetical protein